jgi:enamine deaminase RidA (YjgF/YER057c/UK114 family)
MSRLALGFGVPECYGSNGEKPSEGAKRFGPGDMRAQLEQTFKNLDLCLKAAGATWADVVKTNTFVTNYQEFSKHSDVRMRYFGVASPTSTTIQISGLAQPEAMVEIEMIAVVEG